MKRRIYTQTNQSDIIMDMMMEENGNKLNIIFYPALLNSNFIVAEYKGKGNLDDIADVPYDSISNQMTRNPYDIHVNKDTGKISYTINRQGMIQFKSFVTQLVKDVKDLKNQSNPVVEWANDYSFRTDEKGNLSYYICAYPIMRDGSVPPVDLELTIRSSNHPPDPRNVDNPSNFKDKRIPESGTTPEHQRKEILNWLISRASILRGRSNKNKKKYKKEN